MGRLIIIPFYGAIDAPIFDFWWYLPWVSKPRWIPHFCALSPACNVFFRFTSGATSADLLVSSMVVESFEPHTCTCVQPLMGLNPGILFVIHWTALRLETTWKFGYIASNGSIHTRIYNSDWAYNVTLNSVWRWCAAMTKNRYMWTNVNSPLLSQSHCTCYCGIVWTRCKTVTHVIRVSLSNK